MSFSVVIGCDWECFGICLPFLIKLFGDCVATNSSLPTLSIPFPTINHSFPISLSTLLSASIVPFPIGWILPIVCFSLVPAIVSVLVPGTLPACPP